MIVALAALALIVAILTPKYLRSESIGRRVEAWEAPLRRFGPLGAGLLSMAVVWFAWDALMPVPKIHDESSYLLQAEIFARGRWTMPPPPIPEFFEQPHVQVVPVLASKYPPGHALLLSLGALVGFPPLVPLLLTGITAALLFALAARVTNPWGALITWMLWTSAPIVLRFQPSYMSELTTGALVLAAWWALLEWRETRRRRWLVLLALAIGWGAITRPLTMLAIALPIAVVTIRDVVRLRLWRDFGLAFASGVALLCILPLWSARTTGSWRVSPIEQYRKDYLPFDRVGFTPDTSAPRRVLSPVLKYVYDYFLFARKEQRIERLPLIAADRFVNLAIAFFQGSRLPLILFAIAGLFVKNHALRFGAVSALALFIAHLPYAHWATWTVYYLEITPVVAAITAAGLWRELRRVTEAERGARLGAVLVTAVLVAFAIPAVDHWRGDHRMRGRLFGQFARELERLPRLSIAFVRYSPGAHHVSVVFNPSDLEAAPVWVVHDLGARNDELRRLAPHRQTFEFEEEQLVERLSR